MNPTARRALALLLPLACAAAPHAHAQDAPPFDPARVPVRGTRVQDFAPAGWKVAGQTDGDLDGDGRADHVLHLVPRGTDYDPDAVSAAPEAHALVVVLAGSGGTLRRAGVAPRLLETLAPQYGLRLAIRRGVLIVNQNFGMTDVLDLTHRFRYDAPSGRFVLIGRDVFSYHRPQEMTEPVRTSENYLTGVRLITTGHWGRGGAYREAERRETIPRTRATMEEVDESSEG